MRKRGVDDYMLMDDCRGEQMARSNCGRYMPFLDCTDGMQNKLASLWYIEVTLLLSWYLNNMLPVYIWICPFPSPKLSCAQAPPLKMGRVECAREKTGRLFICWRWGFGFAALLWFNEYDNEQARDQDDQ